MAEPCAPIRSRNLKTYLVDWNNLVGWLLTHGELPCMVGYGQINRRIKHMDTLPAHIADMCGLVMTPAPAPEPAAPKYDSPIQLVDDGDGVKVLTYFGKIVGWMNKTKLDRRDGAAYRAVSVHGDVRLCWSEKMAKDWLLERYH